MNVDVIAKLKKLSNLDYCGSADDMQNALERINDLLNELYPEIGEDDVASPITEKKMTLIQELRTITYQGKEYSIIFHYYLCEESGERFTTTELDEININQVFKQANDESQNN